MEDLTQMTDERLAEIAAREQGATAGPWFLIGWINPVAQTEMFGVGSPGRAIFSQIATRKDLRSGAVELPREDDYEFIAHARADIPALLAEVRRLRKENTELSHLLDGDPELGVTF